MFIEATQGHQRGVKKKPAVALSVSFMLSMILDRLLGTTATISREEKEKEKENPNGEECT